MLNLVSTKRSNRSNRLMRCEPLWDANALSTQSPCPPACRNYEIGPGFFCGVCLEFHPRDQHAIDASNPPPPECNEDRLSRLIHEWEAVMGDGEGLKADAIQRIREKIRGLRAELKVELEDSSNHPTECSPALPGGIGSLKAKPLWFLPGLPGAEFRVQAWTKGEATAQFSKLLRARGEKGRFSVPISNPQRVK